MPRTCPVVRTCLWQWRHLAESVHLADAKALFRLGYFEVLMYPAALSPRPSFLVSMSFLFVSSHPMRISFRSLLLLVTFASARVESAPLLEKIDVFTGAEGGYVLYRIPGVVVTKRGTVLAYAEGRRNSRSDWASIDIVMRRSFDGGKTWQSMQQVAHHGAPVPRNPVALERRQGETGDRTTNNPVAIADAESGAVHFLYCVEYARVFYVRSDDD